MEKGTEVELKDDTLAAALINVRPDDTVKVAEYFPESEQVRLSIDGRVTNARIPAAKINVIE